MLFGCLMLEVCFDLDFANVDTRTIGFAHLHFFVYTCGTEVLDVQYTIVMTIWLCN